MITRLLLVLFFSAIALDSVFSSSEPRVRSDQELCIELSREVNISVESGLLTKEEAEAISARCYQLYGGK